MRQNPREFAAPFVVASWTQAGTSAATINRRLAILRHGYRLGKVRLDPVRLDFTDVFLREKSPRGRYLTGDAFEAIHKHLPTAELRDFFEFAYFCGTRKQQLARTTWAHLDAERWVLTWQATDTKQHEPHVLPLAGRPLDIIKARFEHGRRPQWSLIETHGPRCGGYRVVTGPETSTGCRILCPCRAGRR